MSDLKIGDLATHPLLQEFADDCEPLENKAQLLVLADERTEAQFCECHIKANKLVSLGTTDVPLDHEEQPEYRANRELVEDSSAYRTMIEDAKGRRSFSNIVAEYTKEFDDEHPLKIIGGQHRFSAIREALTSGVDVYHGVKVYMGLNVTQRLDVQLISNTNIAISRDLIDRLQEGFQGPALRDWCQKVGLLDAGQDFADSYERGGPISVKIARTFILNYFKGMKVDPQNFAISDTSPIIAATGGADPDWTKFKADNPKLWTHTQLLEAGNEFSKLVKAQKSAFARMQGKKAKPDYPEKALNIAVVSAWAFVAGMLHTNHARLKRHFEIKNASGKDPLNAAALAKGRHKSDPTTYRGLGYRTDPQERGRLVELFFRQTEKGTGITPSAIEIAIADYHVKQAQLDALKAREKEKAKGK